MHGILAVHTSRHITPDFPSGAQFFDPVEPYAGECAGQLIQIACTGAFDNGGALVERAGVTNFRSTQPAEIVFHLLREQMRHRSLFAAFVQLMPDLAGDFSIVIATGSVTEKVSDALLAVSTVRRPLYLSAHADVIALATASDSFARAGDLLKVAMSKKDRLMAGLLFDTHIRLDPGQVFCKMIDTPSCYAVPGRRRLSVPAPHTLH